MYKKFLRPYIEKTTQFNNEPKALHQRNYLDEKPAHEVMFNIFIKMQIKTMVRYYYIHIYYNAFHENNKLRNPGKNEGLLNLSITGGSVK